MKRRLQASRIIWIVHSCLYIRQRYRRQVAGWTFENFLRPLDHDKDEHEDDQN